MNFKSSNQNLQQSPNLMIGGFGFVPGTSMKVGKLQFDNNSSHEDDSDMRPSQIDEFVEVKQEFGVGGGHITSSYITIGDDDPFLTGRFCDASTKQFNFKPNNPSKCNHSSLKQSELKQSTHTNRYK